MRTKTESGVEVTITPATQNSYIGHFAEPKFSLTMADGQAVTGTLGLWVEKVSAADCRCSGFKFGGTTQYKIGLTIPKTDYDLAFAESGEILANEIAELEAKKEAIRDGKIKIELSWSEGSILSGYICCDKQASQLLDELGLLKQIDGWGMIFNHQAAEKLGKSFLYAEAVEFVRPAREAKEGKRAAAAVAENRVFATAKETGKKQLLARRTENCDGSVDECSTDIVYVFAMPDGSTQTERTHTY